MSRSMRRVTTTLVVVLSSWSCGGTAPSAAPQVAAIVVSPATSTLEPDAQLPLRAQVQDGSGAILPDADVTWTVQDPRIVSVSAAGVVKALAVGTSQVAANALGKFGIAVITVASPITTGPTNPGNDDPGNAGPVGDDPGNDDPGDDDPGDDSGDGNAGDADSGDENAGDDDAGSGNSGDDSGDGNPGDDDPANGEPGDDDSGNGTADPGVVATVTVTAPSTELATGSTMQLSAVARDDKGNPVPQQSFVWSSSDVGKATVSSSGVVEAKQPGNVTITAQTSTAGGKSGSVRLQIRKR